MDNALKTAAVCVLMLALTATAGTAAPGYAQTTGDQLSQASSLRFCSDFKRSQYESVSSAEIWSVASESMSPILRLGDTVAVNTSAALEDIQVGDIILFKEPVPDSEVADAIISRVNEIINDPIDQLVVVTKGDANSGSIPGIDFPIYEKDFIGIVDCLLEAGSE